MHGTAPYYIDGAGKAGPAWPVSGWYFARRDGFVVGPFETETAAKAAQHPER